MVTIYFDKEGNKQPWPEVINNVNDEIITKWHVTSLSKYNTH